jgi:hypothetical protein
LSKRKDNRITRIGDLLLEQRGRFLVTRNLRAPESQAEFVSEMATYHRDLPKRISEAVSKLAAELAKYEPFDVLASLWFRYNYANPETFKEYEMEGSPAFAEYAALLLLRCPYHSPEERRPLGANELEPIERLLEEIFLLTQWYYGTEFAKADDALHPGPRDDARFTTIVYELMVRNPGYPHHFVDILRRLFQPLSTDLEELLGFTIDDALAMLEAFQRITSAKLVERRDQALRTERELRRSVTRYRRTGDLSGEWPQQLLERLSALPEKKARRDIRRAVGAWLFVALGDTMSFTSADLAEEAKVSTDKARAFLDALSIRFGEVAPDFAMPAPTHALQSRPFVTQAGRYLCPSTALLPWALRPCLEEKLKARASVWERYQRSRASFLESYTLQLFRQILRHGEFYHNLDYTHNGTPTELDGLVVFDGRVFLIECRSGALTPPARRGAPAQVVTDLKKLVADAHGQALRAQDYIRSSDQAVFTLPDGGSLTLRRDELKEFFLVTVTLDSLTPFTSTLHEIAELGIFQSDELPWAVNVLDLRVVAEMVEFPSQFLHFLHRRLRLNELKAVVAVDELDWLGHYLLEGLYFDDWIAGGMQHINLLSYTTAFDDYYLYETGERKTPAAKPRQRMPDTLREIGGVLEEQHPENHSDVVMALLDMGDKARRTFVKSLERIRRLAEKDGRVHDFTFAFEGSRGLTVMASSSMDPERLHERLSAYSLLKKYQARTPEWVGLISHTRLPGLVQGAVVIRSPWEFDADLEKLVQTLPSSNDTPQ